MAHYLLTLAAKYYQLEDLDPHAHLELIDQPVKPVNNPPRVSHTRNASRVTKPVLPKPIRTKKEGWDYVQRIILSELVATSKAINGKYPDSRCILFCWPIYSFVLS